MGYISEKTAAIIEFIKIQWSTKKRESRIKQLIKQLEKPSKVDMSTTLRQKYAPHPRA